MRGVTKELSVLAFNNKEMNSEATATIYYSGGVSKGWCRSQIVHCLFCLA